MPISIHSFHTPPCAISHGLLEELVWAEIITEGIGGHCLFLALCIQMPLDYKAN